MMFVIICELWLGGLLISFVSSVVRLWFRCLSAGSCFDFLDT